MQSIYRFREAEVGLFLQRAARRAARNVKLEPLALATNFRSQAGIVDWVNATFSASFARGGRRSFRRGAVLRRPPRTIPRCRARP